jgi:hypothetical protein
MVNGTNPRHLDSRLDVDLPAPMHDALRDRARANDRTVSAEVRRAIATHLAREEAARDEPA